MEERRECKHKCGRPEMKTRNECSQCCHMRRRYGLTWQQRDQMLEDQNQSCAICSKDVSFQQGKALSSNSAVVDHCHETDTVREILCGQCNVMLGFAKDDPSILKLGIAYLKKHQK